MERYTNIITLPQVSGSLTRPDDRVLQERIASTHETLPMRALIILDGKDDRELDPILVDLANRLHVRRHEVISVIAGRSGNFPSTQDFMVPPLPDLRCTNSIGLARRIAGLIVEYQPTMIIAGSHFTRHPSLVAAETSKRRPRVVLYKNEGLSELPITARFNSTMILPMADLIIATSETAKDDILHYSSDLRIRTQALYAPHINADIKLRSKVKIHHPWITEPTAPLFLMHEALTASKHQINIINKIAELARPMPTRLMIFGAGPGRKSLQRRIDKLDIPHLVSIQDPVDDISPYIARANGFLRADPSTSIPRSLVESMYLGCPVIAFAHDDAVREAIISQDCGIRIDRNDSDALTNAMHDAINRIRNPAARSAARFEHDNVIDQHVNACLSVRFLQRKKTDLRIDAAGVGLKLLSIGASK